MNIVILGPGAIGALWATKLQTADHNVSVWSTSSDKTLSLALDQQVPQTFANQNVSAVEQADLVLVTVKAWQVRSALKPLISHINSDAIITLMHNGMGTAESIENLLPTNPLVLATTTHGAYKANKQQVLHTGAGQTQLGGYNAKGKECAFLAEVLTHALPPVYWNEHIEHALWTKLAINCVINPLTAIHQVKNGQLSDTEHQLVIEKLVTEISTVLAAEALPHSREELILIVNQVIEATAENYSSMHQDIVHHRQSEIDFITGYLLERADFHKIAVPKNQELYQAIKHIEQSWNL